MFLIECPHCGEAREEEEFHPAGEAHIARPADPDACSDAEWAEYIYLRSNPRGIHHELWVHAAGCRKFFHIERDTLTYEILRTAKLGEMKEPAA
ncbi:MAG: sarcosine oxidase subunit delta [Gammaproteobacteria bacterium]|nr:MAG: sarcosine oxidase subunit delta [Gammaproteobacteria bacterium]